MLFCKDLNQFIVTGAFAVLLALTFPCAAERTRKKLIEYGWGVPYPDQLLEKLHNIEKRPFDGIMFRLRDTNRVFDVRRWEEAEVQPQVDQLARVRWRNLTHNFLTVYVGNDDAKMDWFDDDQWSIIEANMKLTMRAAKAARAVGICFDPESWTKNKPWKYPGKYGDYTFEQVEAKVRQRGAQFMRVVQEANPRVRLLTLHLASGFARHFPVVRDEASRRRVLLETAETMLPAFQNGMLDAVGPEVQIIDGFSGTYWTATGDGFRRGYHRVRQGGLALIAPENHGRYLAHVQVGAAMFVDAIFGTYGEKGSRLGHYVTNRTREQWAESHIYHMLATVDEYAWVYTERMNWYGEQLFPPLTILDPIIRRARGKHDGDEVLGFDPEPGLIKGMARIDEHIERQVKTRRATIRRCAADAPKIDGVPDDTAWRDATELGAPVRIAGSTYSVVAHGSFLPRWGFAGLRMRAGLPAWDIPAHVAMLDEATGTVATTVRMTYDDAALYVAIRCDELSEAAIRASGRRRDADAIGDGDYVELSISRHVNPIRHVTFVVNPDGLQWDADSDDVSWDAAWQSAVHRADNYWSVEIAVPWSAISSAPGSGAVRRANICRQRTAHPELTSWSPTVTRLRDPRFFGTLEFE